MFAPLSVSVSVTACLCLCMSACVSACVSVCLCVCVCLLVCASICVCMYMCVYVCVCVCMRVCIYMCVITFFPPETITGLDVYNVCVCVCLCVFVCVWLFVCLSLCLTHTCTFHTSLVAELHNAICLPPVCDGAWLCAIQPTMAIEKTGISAEALFLAPKNLFVSAVAIISRRNSKLEAKCLNVSVY